MTALPLRLGMSPLNCLGMQDVSGSEYSNSTTGTGQTRYFCFVRVGGMLLYPTINHYEGCSNCTAIAADADLRQVRECVSSPHPPPVPLLPVPPIHTFQRCNEQNILTTLIYYPFENIFYFPETINAVAFLKGVLFGIPNADNVLNSASYSSSKLTVDSVKSGGDGVTDADVSREYSSVCQGAGLPCTIITFQAADALLPDYSVNGYSHQVYNAACSNSGKGCWICV